MKCRIKKLRETCDKESLKKIMILVGSDSVILPNYIKELLKVKRFHITVMSWRKTQWLKFYKKYNIKYIYKPERISGLSDFVYWLRAWMFMLVSRGSYDFVHVQSVVGSGMKYGEMLRAGKGKLILTYWGADIYNKKHEAFKREKCYLDQAYKVTVMINDMKKILNREYQFCFDEKCSVLDFGDIVIDCMSRYLSQYGEARLKKMSRKHYHMPQDKIVVAIGYCGREEQQHIRVINQIKSFPENIKERLFLYCHMSYGVLSERYVRQVKSALEQCGCAYTISDQFMNSSEIAVMKMGVDIFVHAQKFDALSSSMIEYVYAGKKVFNPEWLAYNLQDEVGAQDITYKDFEDLGAKLLQAIEVPDWEPQIRESNRRAVEGSKSWKYLMPEWIKLYQ